MSSTTRHQTTAMPPPEMMLHDSNNNTNVSESNTLLPPLHVDRRSTNVGSTCQHCTSNSSSFWIASTAVVALVIIVTIVTASSSSSSSFSRYDHPSIDTAGTVEEHIEEQTANVFPTAMSNQQHLLPEQSSVVVLELEGKKKKKKKQKSHPHAMNDDDNEDAGVENNTVVDDDDSIIKSILETNCEDGHYSQRTLQLINEIPFASMFRHPTKQKGVRKFEASSVFVSEQQHKTDDIDTDDDSPIVYAVCDSSWSISKFDLHFLPFSDKNVLIDNVDPTSGSDVNVVEEEEEDSGYESIFIDDGTFYVVREAVDHSSYNDDDDNHKKTKHTTSSSHTLQGYHAIIEELKILPDDDGYIIQRICSSEYEFDGDSKGFEGAVSIHDMNNNVVILGLCEGNYCSSGQDGKTIGHGRIIAMQLVNDTSSTNTTTTTTATTGNCLWKTIKEIHIPKSAAFQDYSDISMTSTGKVAITSQENSQLWIGQLLGQDNVTGLWDITKLEFDHDDTNTVVYDFPKDNMCNTIYCNIEGIQWIDDDIVLAVSDKMKGHGKQSYHCFDKDQSVHMFMLP